MNTITEKPVEYSVIAVAPNYRVGSDGSAWTRRQKVGNRWVDGDWTAMSPSVHHDGYRYITLYADGRARSRKVSVLVCLAFIGPKPDGPGRQECCHDNGIPTDDRTSNLYWGTTKKNAEDRDGHGERNGFAKLTDAQIADLLALKGVVSQTEAGKRFGISQVHVGRIWAGNRASR